MWKTDVVFILVALHLQYASTLECYRCKDVAHITECQSSVQCPSGSSCQATVVQNKYSLDCVKNELCGLPSVPSGGSGIVGRSVSEAAQAGCSQCCNTSNCNRQLCQSTDPSCHDSGTIDCALTATVVNVCSDTDHAKKTCRHFCGLCSQGAGSWELWESWGQCSVTCGIGLRRRERACATPYPVPCTGDARETQVCLKTACIGLSLIESMP